MVAVESSSCDCLSLRAPLLGAPVGPKMTREDTPSTVASDSDPDLAGVNAFGEADSAHASAIEAETADAAIAAGDAQGAADEEAHTPRQLGPGLYSDDDVREGSETRQLQPGSVQPARGAGASAEDRAPSEGATQQPSAAGAAEGDTPGCAKDSGGQEVPASAPFSQDETLMVWDWDDTILPSSFLQRQGLRLDANSHTNAQQREVLAEVAIAVARTMSVARRHGTVVLVTNAERGWIELSCRKFLPALLPLLEGVKIVSARTSYEGLQCSSPLQWKLSAFAAEITNHFGSKVLADTSSRKNVFSFGDSLHEREALMVATSALPSCRTKALKFVERPDISQILKQHELILGCFERIVHYDGDLDLCIKCP